MRIAKLQENYIKKGRGRELVQTTLHSFKHTIIKSLLRDGQLDTKDGKRSEFITLYLDSIKNKFRVFFGRLFETYCTELILSIEEKIRGKVIPEFEYLPGPKSPDLF
jgi:hypothetical protein